MNQFNLSNYFIEAWQFRVAGHGYVSRTSSYDKSPEEIGTTAIILSCMSGIIYWREEEKWDTECLIKHV